MFDNHALNCPWQHKTQKKSPPGRLILSEPKLTTLQNKGILTDLKHPTQMSFYNVDTKSQVHYLISLVRSVLANCCGKP